eukprot:4359554-Pleurochrysis_carterae.AAC.1
MRTKTVAVGDDDMSSLRNELRELREQMAAMGITSVMRTTTSAKPCDKCNVPHCGKCYGEAIATGNMTLEQAAEKFTFISDAAR